MADKPRPVRNLAAYGDDYTGTEVEVDVWTVNAVEKELPDASEIPAAGNIAKVLDAAGDVAKVDYSGAAGTGYVRISSGETVAQQAFAGAARAAGTTRTEEGTFTPGGWFAHRGPSLDDVKREAESNVIPTVINELRGELGDNINPSLDRDKTEDREPTNERPTRGIENVVRIEDRGKEYRYKVSNNTLVRQ